MGGGGGGGVGGGDLGTSAPLIPLFLDNLTISKTKNRFLVYLMGTLPRGGMYPQQQRYLLRPMGNLENWAKSAGLRGYTNQYILI